MTLELDDQALDQLAVLIAAKVSAPTGCLVDATAASQKLGVPKTWLLAEARAGRIPHIRLGRYVRFEPEELAAWWRAQRRGPEVQR